MQFRDLHAQYQAMKTEIDKAISDVITECNFISGKQVQDLERELEEYTGMKHCISCGNGTDALSMMMMAWNIKVGDAVFVPDFTFFSSGEIVSFAGATPVFYDVCEDTFNADVRSLEQAILEVRREGKLVPRAIVAVDLFGQPADYEALEKIAAEYGLLLLEDGAQGFGGRIGERAACSFGNAATTSFFPAKPLGCYGDGGAVFTNSDEEAELLRSIRIHGKGTFKYDNVRIGWNSRLDTIQAAVLQVKLKAFKEYELENVNQVAEWYSESLKDLVETPVVKAGFYSSWAQYTIKLPNEEVRNGLQSFLKEAGIPSMIYYPKPMHLQKAFEGVKSYVPCNVTEALCGRVLALPMHPYMDKNVVKKVCKEIEKYLLEK